MPLNGFQTRPRHDLYYCNSDEAFWCYMSEGFFNFNIISIGSFSLILGM